MVYVDVKQHSTIYCWSDRGVQAPVRQCRLPQSCRTEWPAVGPLRDVASGSCLMIQSSGPEWLESDSTQTHVDSVPIFRLRINEVLLRRLQHSRCAVLCASLMGHKSGILFLLLFRYRHSSESLPIFKDFPCSLSLAGAATSIIFVTAKVLLWQNTSFVATKVCSSRQAYFCQDKHMFVMTKCVFCPNVFCCNNSMLVTTKLLVTNAWCRNKYLSQQSFVATILVECDEVRCVIHSTFQQYFTSNHISSTANHTTSHIIPHQTTFPILSLVRQSTSFIATKVCLSWQTEVCRNKTTSILLSQQT